MNSDVGSEIPELGLDRGRFNVDCDINPARVADAAVRVAKTYGEYRRRRQPQRASSRLKRKRTRISIESDYRKEREDGDDDD